MTGWLSPYRVVDLTDERGLIAGQMLARLGADVIQVEPPEGSPARLMGPFDDDGRSLYWSAFAVGKRGIVLDLETDAAREQLHRLLADADILIESADPGRLAALGLTPETLAARHPHLIHVSITAFGSDGPKRDWAATDLTLWAAAGPLWPHRDFEGPPLRISVPQAWLHAGADAAAGALIALFARLRTGRGQRVDIAAQQSVTPTTLSFIAAAAVGHENYTLFPRPIRPPGDAGELRGPKWRVADGFVELGIGGGPFAVRTNLLFDWMRESGALAGGLRDLNWASVPLRPTPDDPVLATIAEARDAIAAFLAPFPKAELERQAVSRKLLLAPVNTMADLLASEHLKARDFFATFKEAGEPRTLPGRFAVGPADMFAPPRAAPALGEHDAEILGAPLGQPVRQSVDVSEPTLRPLEGLKVLDLAWVVAGPAIGRTLADFGATVIRVESSVRIETARLMGPFLNGVPDPQRCALYDTYNVGKLGLALDLATPDGQQVARDMARWADVVVESFIPGQMARWGLSAESLRAAKPDLIVVSTSLMGQSGPSSALSGYGNVGAAMSGYQSIVGRPGEAPIGPYGPYTDFIGPRYGLVSLLAALDRRRRTGEGCRLDISQAEAGIQFLAPQIAETAATGRVAGPLGNRDPRMAPHGVFACAGEDEWIAITVRDDAEWARLATLIGGEATDPSFAVLPGRKADEDRLEAITEAWTAPQTAERIEAALQAVGVPAHRVANSPDTLADSQLIHRGHFVRLPHPLGGDCVIEASRFQLSETPPEYRRAAPHFGRDNREVLADVLGYDDARIAALEAAGILK